MLALTRLSLNLPSPTLPLTAARSPLTRTSPTLALALTTLCPLSRPSLSTEI